MATTAQKKAIAKYDAANTIQFKVKLNLNTDADIISEIRKHDNKQGYIKDLIRKDIEMKENMISEIIKLEFEGKISAEQGYRLRQLAEEGVDVKMGLAGRVDGTVRCLRLSDAVRAGDHEEIQRLIEDTRAAREEDSRKIEEHVRQ